MEGKRVHALVGSILLGDWLISTAVIVACIPAASFPGPRAVVSRGGRSSGRHLPENRSRPVSWWTWCATERRASETRGKRQGHVRRPEGGSSSRMQPHDVDRFQRKTTTGMKKPHTGGHFIHFVHPPCE